VRLGVVQAGGGATRWMSVPGDPREHYIPRFEWIDAATLALHHTQRRQNADELLLASSRTGSVTTALQRNLEDVARCVGPAGDRSRSHRVLAAQREPVHVDQRQGRMRHIYAVSRDGRQETLVTRFAGDAVNLVAARSGARRPVLHCITRQRDAAVLVYRQREGRVGHAGHAGCAGGHARVRYLADGRWAFDTWSRADVPPRTDLVSLPGITGSCGRS